MIHTKSIFYTYIMEINTYDRTELSHYQVQLKIQIEKHKAKQKSE